MADIQLIIYTKLLKYRTAHSGRIDVNILNLSEAERPNTYNEHLGRYIGWFILTDDRPGLLLLARQRIGGDISHACLLYANTDYEDFPLSERSALNRKLPVEPKLAVINIRSNTEQFCEYSVLLEAIQCVISRDIFKEEPPLYVVLEGLGSLTSPRELRHNKTQCDLDMTSEAVIVRQFMVTKHLMLVDMNQSQPVPASFNIMRMRYNGHYIYGINYRHEQTMLLLLPHIEQFPQDLYFVKLEERIEHMFPGQYKTYYSVRPRFVTDCNSSTILKICILLTQVPLFFVDPSDVDAVLHDLGILSIETSTRPPPDKASQLRNIANKTQYNGPKPIVTLKLTANSKRPEVLSVKNRRPSQELSMNSQQAFRREIRAYRAWMALADDASAPHPSTSDAQPMNMPRGTILNNFDWLSRQLRYVVRYWEQYATTKLMQPMSIGELRTHNFENKQVRFIILPLGSDSKEHNIGLMIFDKELKAWRWMHPNNSAAKSKDIITFVKRQIMSHFPLYSDWSAELIILTSSYHKDYPYVHLIMGMYRVAQCFRYSVQLPIKIVYNEKAFRNYSYQYCLAVQVLNQQRNLDKNLVSEDAQLLDGAYISLPSPVQYERSVVPSDLCPFCKERNFSNLGRHISMKHGGQAQMANEARIIQYGYSTKD